MKTKIDIKIFFVLIAYVLTKRIQAFGLIFIFLILHEIGHILSGIFLGLKLKKINLSIAGFCLEFRSRSGKYKTSLIDKIIIDSAGPMVNMLFLIIGFVINNENIFYANSLIFLVNMFPILPLDGGRIIKDVLELKFNHRTINYVMLEISKYNLIILTFISSIIIIYVNNAFLGVFIFYLWYLYIKEKRESLVVEKLYGIMSNMKDKEYY